MILAGDIGGTKTNLALFTLESGHWITPFEATYPSQNYSGLESLVDDFLKQAQVHHRIEAAGFGVAGPVVGTRCVTTNLPWTITIPNLQKQLECEKVFLINDLEAMSASIPILSQNELVSLNPNSSTQTGNVALIAAGTGLGEALLYWDGEQFRSVASEGGHADFAPRNDRQMGLWHYWQQRLAYVSYESLLSGPGLLRIYQFLKEGGYGEEPAWLSQLLNQRNSSAVIAETGLANENELCVQALEMFVAIYGAEAGNLALKFKALGGVYLGGGIAPKILDKLRGGTFMQAFLDKGRFANFLASIPVYVILNPKAGLLGAAQYVAQMGLDRPSLKQRKN